MRRVQRQEHLPARRPGRAPVAQVAGQRAADVGRQRNLAGPVSLAADGNDSLAPGNVVQQQPGGFPGPQRQPQEQRHHRLVPQPARGRPHEREELRCLHGAEALRDCRAGRGGERPDELRERDGGQAFQPREAQQRPDGVRPDLRGPGPQPRGTLGSQDGDLDSGQAAELPGAGIGERPCLVKVAGHSGRGQAPLTGQPSPEPRQQHVRGLARHDDRGRRDGTEFPQVAQHRPERSFRPQLHPFPPDGGVLAGHLAGQPGQRHVALREPACQVPQQRALPPSASGLRFVIWPDASVRRSG